MGGSGKGQGFEGGGEFRVRGNAHQILERYLQLARDAGTAGDRVAAENYLQHADHYYRVLSAHQDGQRPRIGGREVSVADVNVQNVSQGLSAALSTSSSQMQGQTSVAGEGPEAMNANPMDNGQPLRDGSQDFNRGPASGHSRPQGMGEAQPPRGNYTHAPGAPVDGPVADQIPTAPEPIAHRRIDNAPNDEQPDYPEELLPRESANVAASGEAPAAPTVAVERTQEPDQSGRSRLRHRLRGPRRARGPGEETPGQDGPDQ
jgi:hypothetical protein